MSEEASEEFSETGSEGSGEAVCEAVGFGEGLTTGSGVSEVQPANANTARITTALSHAADFFRFIFIQSTFLSILHAFSLVCSYHTTSLDRKQLQKNERIATVLSFFISVQHCMQPACHQWKQLSLYGRQLCKWKRVFPFSGFYGETGTMEGINKPVFKPTHRSQRFGL